MLLNEKVTELSFLPWRVCYVTEALVDIHSVHLNELPIDGINFQSDDQKVL